MLLPFLFLAAVCLAPLPAATASNPGHATAELALSHTTAAPGATIDALVTITPDAGWHVYWQNPGDSGLAPRLAWQLPTGASHGAIAWPVPSVYQASGMTTFVYHHPVTLLVPITAPTTPGDHTISVDVAWLACAEACVPGSATLTTPLSVGESTADPAAAEQRAAALAALPMAGRSDGPRMRVTRHDDHLALAIEPTPRSVQILPLTAGLVDHGAATSPLTRSGSAWRVPLATPITNTDQAIGWLISIDEQPFVAHLHSIHTP